MICGQARPDHGFVAKSPHMLAKPLLFVDTDRVISRRGSGFNDRPAGAFQNVDGDIHFLSSGAGIHLLTPAGAGAGR